MKMFSQEQFNLLLRGVFIAGTLLVLLFVASERAGFISFWGLFLGMEAILILCLIGVAGWKMGLFRTSQKDVVQFSHMNMDEQKKSEESRVPEKNEILSPEQAREWLDEFLLQQQNVHK